ncbi:hypothetical protein K2W90_03280 [Candidatus Babeliales bacterium]|nr:hypothetical protein [Candidatus Babeliales bacterium]
MKNLSVKIVLLSIIALSLPTAHSKEELRLAKTDLQVLSNNIQIGQNNADKNRRDLEVTRETFLRKNLVIGSGGNIETPATQNNPEVRNCGCARHISTLDFNPNTQLLCIEFCTNDSDSNGAWVNLNFCGKAVPRYQQEELESIIPISSTYTRLFVSSSDPEDDSYLWANSEVIRDDQGENNCPYGTCIYSFYFQQAQYPYKTGPCVDSTKVYIGLFDDDDNEWAFYLQDTYDYVFQSGCLFADVISCNIKHVSVVDIPQEFFEFDSVLQEKIRFVVEQENSNVFQIFGVAHYIAITEGLESALTALVNGNESEVEQACNQIYGIWLNLYVCD